MSEKQTALTVIPVLSSGARRAFWVVFEPAQVKTDRLGELLESAAKPLTCSGGTLAREEEELERTREYLQIAMEQYELASARLDLLAVSAQSSQEELQSVT